MHFPPLDGSSNGWVKNRGLLQFWETTILSDKQPKHVSFWNTHFLAINKKWQIIDLSFSNKSKRFASIVELMYHHCHFVKENRMIKRYNLTMHLYRKSYYIGDRTISCFKSFKEIKAMNCLSIRDLSFTLESHILMHLKSLFLSDNLFYYFKWD